MGNGQSWRQYVASQSCCGSVHPTPEEKEMNMELHQKATKTKSKKQSKPHIPSSSDV